jgi:hypothetical protein
MARLYGILCCVLNYVSRDMLGRWVRYVKRRKYRNVDGEHGVDRGN